MSSLKSMIVTMEKLVKTQIPRIELMKRLDSLSAVSEHGIYIHAPAGFGKTTSALLWLKRRNSASGWLGLDEHDNKTSTFCRS